MATSEDNTPSPPVPSPRPRRRKVRHGMNGTPEYNTWRSMLYRCQNPKHQVFPYYGGRGITVCERWSLSFLDFYADMGPRPGKEYSLDRIDNNRGYEPGNCRWATRKEQMRNVRDNVVLEYKGGRKILIEWAEDAGLSFDILHSRLFDLGWSMERAMTTPPQRMLTPDEVREIRRRHAAGENRRDIARDFGICPGSVNGAVSRRTHKDVD